jgi:predicted transcriptional regulator
VPFPSRLTEGQTQRQLVRDLIDRAFGGSAASLMLQVLGTKTTSPHELAELQSLLDRRRRQRDE